MEKNESQAFEQILNFLCPDKQYNPETITQLENICKIVQQCESSKSTAKLESIQNHEIKSFMTEIYKNQSFADFLKLFMKSIANLKNIVLPNVSNFFKDKKFLKLSYSEKVNLLNEMNKIYKRINSENTDMNSNTVTNENFSKIFSLEMIENASKYKSKEFIQLVEKELSSLNANLDKDENEIIFVEFLFSKILYIIKFNKLTLQITIIYDKAEYYLDLKESDYFTQNHKLCLFELDDSMLSSSYNPSINLLNYLKFLQSSSSAYYVELIKTQNLKDYLINYPINLLLVNNMDFFEEFCRKSAFNYQNAQLINETNLKDLNDLIKIIN